MERIDRLGWADGLSFNAYGTKIGIRTNRPEILEQIQSHLPPGWKPAPSPIVERLYSLRAGGPGARPGARQFHLLYADTARLVRTMEMDDILQSFASDVESYVADAARRRVFVHAGVVGWKGRAIVIPGRSYSGKTSMVAELVRAGATYYSDEYAVLDARGRVYPYARPLEIRVSPDGKQQSFPVESLGGHAGTRPLPVGLVVVTHFKAGAKWRPQAITSGQGTLALLANTISARRQPQMVMATLQQVVTETRFLKGVRGEASATAAALLQYLDGEAGHRLTAFATASPLYP